MKFAFIIPSRPHEVKPFSSRKRDFQKVFAKLRLLLEKCIVSAGFGFRFHADFLAYQLVYAELAMAVSGLMQARIARPIEYIQWNFKWKDDHH